MVSPEQRSIREFIPHPSRRHWQESWSDDQGAEGPRSHVSALHRVEIILNRTFCRNDKDKEYHVKLYQEFIVMAPEFEGIIKCSKTDNDAFKNLLGKVRGYMHI